MALNAHDREIQLKNSKQQADVSYINAKAALVKAEIAEVEARMKNGKMSPREQAEVNHMNALTAKILAETKALELVNRKEEDELMLRPLVEQYVKVLEELDFWETEENPGLPYEMLMIRKKALEDNLRNTVNKTVSEK